MFWINFFIFLETLALVLYSLFPKNIFKIFLIINFLVLLIIQISTTRLITVTEYSGLEKYFIERRADGTPMYLRYIDPPFFYRIREYLFSLLKSVSPLLLLGFYSYVLKPNRLITALLITTLLLFSLISPNGKYGPILFSPFIYFLTLYAIRLVKK